MRLRTTATAIVAAAIMTVGIYGCTGRTQLASNWGRSVEQARVNQTLHPDTGRDATPVEGLDGRTAINILERHRQGSCDKKPSASGLGGLASEKK